jgi:serine/threonine protein kinase
MESGGRSDRRGDRGSLRGGPGSFSVDTSVGVDTSGPDTHVFERAGTIIGGRYRIDERVARGGMGVVYRATQLDLERQVAIKAMSSGDRNLLERFRREAIAMAHISHPAVVDVYDFVTVSAPAGGRLYLVMAFIEGQNLRSYARSRPAKRLSAPEVVELFLPVASALVELHDRGIVHRDLKPSNLMRTERTDGRPYLRLVDFGIARRQLDPALTASGSILGTPTYMAPETLVGEKETALSDIYSLGATLYHLVTGKPPRKRGSPRRMLRRMMRQPLHLPEGLDGTPLGGLLKRMLCVGASKRPDAVAVLRSLEEIHRGHVAGTVFERMDVPHGGPWGQTPWSESGPGPQDTGVTTEVDAESAVAQVDDAHGEEVGDAHREEVDDARLPTGSIPLESAAARVRPVAMEPASALVETEDPRDHNVRPHRVGRLGNWATITFALSATLFGLGVLVYVWMQG